MPLTEAQTVSSSHVVGHRPEVLKEILSPDVNLSLWSRPVQTLIAKELLTLDASALPDMRCQTTQSSFDHDVCELLQQRSLDPSSFDNWRTDLRQLADCFFAASNHRSVTMRLVTTNQNGCRRFHADRTNLRLLCTYRGPGTEWLVDDQVDRAALLGGAVNGKIIRYGKPHEFRPAWAGILKGEEYPGNRGHGLVHRSPTISRSGKIRVLFCLDC
ncbi:MAG: DUF1826 domain-containing protein [Pseudomonadota bacterium]